MAGRPLRLLLLIATAAWSTRCLASSLPTTAVPLHDSTFEHDTQASTGQTTGRWAVLFTANTLKRHERAVQVIEELAADEAKEVIYAMVDLDVNQKLARRFGNDLFPPCVVLFRDRMMYVFDKSFDAEDIGQQIKDFVESGFEFATPLDVPPPRDTKKVMERMTQGSQMDMKTVGWGILLILGGLAFQAWAIVNKDKFRPETPQPAKGGAAAATGTEGAAAAAAASGKGKSPAKGAKAS